MRRVGGEGGKMEARGGGGDERRERGETAHEIDLFLILQGPLNQNGTSGRTTSHQLHVKV